MNITSTIHIVRSLPEMLWDATQFFRWALVQEMNRDDDSYEEDDEPLMPNEAGRIALEVAMILRSTQGDQETFQRLIHEVVPTVENPQWSMDVIMALAGMVNAIAEDEDFQRFGSIILKHEARLS